MTEFRTQLGMEIFRQKYAVKWPEKNPEPQPKSNNRYRCKVGTFNKNGALIIDYAPLWQKFNGKEWVKCNGPWGDIDD